MRISNNQGLQHSGKTGKIWKKFRKFEKSEKTSGNFLENHSTQGELRGDFQTSIQLVGAITFCGS